MLSTIYRPVKLVIVVFSLILILTEVAVRFSGITNFPLYVANSEIGYIPAPSQSGVFLRKNSWQFNSKSMGATEFSPSNGEDTLLIGDSVVLGGNPYRDTDRLGPQLREITNELIWPISAGSWALRNELKWLELNPEVVAQSDKIIFILNTGDFGSASSWSCETTHPRTRPLWGTMYVFKKYLWNWKKCNQTPKHLLVPIGDWKVDLHNFFLSTPAKGKKVEIFLYPEQTEMVGKKDIKILESNVTEIVNQALPNFTDLSIWSVGKDSRWRQDFYRDGIHPTVEGTKVLAKIISQPSQQAKLFDSTEQRVNKETQTLNGIKPK